MVLLLAGGLGLLGLRALPPRPIGDRAVTAGLSHSWRERVLTPDRQTAPLRLIAECLLILGVGTLLLAWVYSKTTPAWADRYLAVVVGPLVLLFGLGLARAGRFGLFALALTACFWILDPVPTNRDTKSNVASIAAAVRPHLGANPLVLSTQPEQVPTLAYYLPQVHRFGTPLGSVPDPRVVNWDDALTRLKRSSVRSVLGPLLHTLTPGQRVLLVVPVKFPKTPAWMKLIDEATSRWSYFLRHDHTLKRVVGTDAKYYDAGSPVEAYLYERR
jgi:hypothetical protein